MKTTEIFEIKNEKKIGLIIITIFHSIQGKRIILIQLFLL